jgi:hypothetical protein
MKFQEISPNDQQMLDEVRMGKSDLDKFVDSPEASGIAAGFEAELCFRGLGSGNDDDGGLEEDMSEDTRPDSIDEICDFFDDGDYNGRRAIRELREKLQEEYHEWRMEKMDMVFDREQREIVRNYIEANDFDYDEVIEEYLRDDLGLSEEEVAAAVKAGEEYRTFTRTSQQREAKAQNEAFVHYAEAQDHADTVLEEKTNEAIENQDRNWESAREEWQDEIISEDDDFSEWRWLRDSSYRWMSDISGNFDVTWPHWTRDQNESEDGYSIDNAQILARNLKNALSLKGVTASGGYHSATRKPGLWIIEPDGSLEADEGDMPAEIVSPPMPLKECLDKIKEFFAWAMTEDAYTNESTGLHVGVSLPNVGGRVDYLKLALFLGDQYVLEKFDRMGNTYCRSALEKIKRDATSSSEKIQAGFERIRSGLIELAGETVTNVGGHGKYTSINLKGDYIEFRSMGGDYINRIDEIEDVIKRYAYAMTLAANPDLYRQEYAKKLYKLLSKSGDPTTIQLFAQFNSGILTKEELKQRLKSIRADKKPQQADQEPQSTDAEPSMTQNLPRQGSGEFTGSWLILDNQGRTIHRFGGIGNAQSDANRVAIDWLRANPSNMRSGITVVPEMR